MKECHKYNDQSIRELSQRIRPYLSEKRYSHTIFVMQEAEKLGGIYLPEKIGKLKVAALLHDITKIADFEKQLQYCSEFGIMLDAEHMESPEILHAITGAEIAKRDFSEYVDEEILSAIRNHTTGDAGMTLFDTLINLADYIEESRIHKSCKDIRNYLYDSISSGEDKMIALYDTMIRMFDNTLSYLAERGLLINKDTVAAKDYFMKLRAARYETRG